MQVWQIENPQSMQCQQNTSAVPHTEQVRPRFRLRRFRWSSAIFDFRRTAVPMIQEKAEESNHRQAGVQYSSQLLISRPLRSLTCRASTSRLASWRLVTSGTPKSTAWRRTR